jgi:hypothetical protein
MPPCATTSRSPAELDVAVEVARTYGALGARMTGGGFGGSAIALVPTERAAEVTSAVTQAFADTEYKGTGVQAVVDQQFEVGRQILAGSLVPILEPEIDIHSPSEAPPLTAELRAGLVCRA